MASQLRHAEDLPPNVKPLPQRLNHLVREALTIALTQGAPLPVFPVRPNAKKPLLKNWPSRATTNSALIKSGGAAGRERTSASAVGGEARLLVVDVDPDKGGARAWPRLRPSTARCPKTLTVTTPRGGLHLWSEVPLGRDVPGNSVGQARPRHRYEVRGRLRAGPAEHDQRALLQVGEPRHLDRGCPRLAYRSA